ncbi:glycerol kinase [Ruania alkalisoli]|uniref:ATP:glycerol 3-phosphotransferase n=1 Tax=Ruania alkalisoli TaxID=2779775 RepID=A0A7M1SS54_9MICO|nr:FGGY family carbohydrate kinase [Ruania alkalisoli]QOR70400.1 glycerol kinase [Ruania alkalisoli]
MPEPLVVSVDQGTSATKALVVDPRGRVVGRASVPVSLTHPRPGWVEQDATELLASVHSAVRDAMADAAVENSGAVVSVGLSTQRESALIWDRRTGAPLGPVLGWQDRRTSDGANAFGAGDAARVQEITGLPVDPMFSALKFAWLLDQVDSGRRRARAGEICLGTVDSWIVTRITGEHRIEAGNASRTQLLDLATTGWAPELLDRFAIPAEALPHVVASDEPAATADWGGVSAPLTAVLGDSHASLYGHGARRPGEVKVTYGTGSSVMALAEEAPSSGGLVRTVAWQRGPTAQLALEGNILASGATLVWAADLLGVGVSELADLAVGVGDGGVDLVPAFSGLGAPWWDTAAQATLTGMTLGTGRAEIARAAVDAVVLQVEDVLEAVSRAGTPVATVLADGGGSANDWLMQHQADLSGRQVHRARVSDLSALGAAHLAGDVAGLWTDAPPTPLGQDGPDIFTPRLDPTRADTRRQRWAAAVGRARGLQQ